MERISQALSSFFGLGRQRPFTMPFLPPELRAQILCYLPNPKDFQAMSRVSRSWREDALEPAVLRTHLRQNGARSLPTAPKELLRQANNLVVVPQKMAAGVATWRRLTAAEAAQAAAETAKPKLVPPGHFGHLRYSQSGLWAVTTRSARDTDTVSAWDLRGPKPLEYTLLTRTESLFSVCDFDISNGGRTVVLHASTVDAVFRYNTKTDSYDMEGLFDSEVCGYRSFARTPHMVAVSTDGRWALMDWNLHGKEGVYLLDMRRKKTVARHIRKLPRAFLGSRESMNFRSNNSRIVVEDTNHNVYALDFGLHPARPATLNRIDDTDNC